MAWVVVAAMACSHHEAPVQSVAASIPTVDRTPVTETVVPDASVAAAVASDVALAHGPPSAPDAGAAPAVRVGFLYDSAMMHVRLGLVVGQDGQRPVITDCGRMVGHCDAPRYAATMHHGPVDPVVFGLRCDAAGVQVDSTRVVEIVREAGRVVVRQATVRHGRVAGRFREMGHAALPAGAAVRLATDAELQGVEREQPQW